MICLTVSERRMRFSVVQFDFDLYKTQSAKEEMVPLCSQEGCQNQRILKIPHRSVSISHVGTSSWNPDCLIHSFMIFLKKENASNMFFSSFHLNNLSGHWSVDQICFLRCYSHCCKQMSVLEVVVKDSKVLKEDLPFFPVRFVIIQPFKDGTLHILELSNDIDN